jgi:hypothetical protein
MAIERSGSKMGQPIGNKSKDRKKFANKYYFSNMFSKPDRTENGDDDCFSAF